MMCVNQIEKKNEFGPYVKNSRIPDKRVIFLRIARPKHPGTFH